MSGLSRNRTKPIKTAIDDYKISFNGSHVVIRSFDKKKKIPIGKFLEQGMTIFPNGLYRVICENLRYANLYDRFMDRVYDSIDT